MITLAQRVTELRTERGLSRPQLSAQLGYPKNYAEKLETGRQTPTREQQQALADFFGVSLLYLRGESNDRTSQKDWMDLAMTSDEPGHVPMASAKSAAKPAKTSPSSSQGALFDSLLASKQVQELLRGVVLDTMRSPEGQEILTNLIRKELNRR